MEWAHVATKVKQIGVQKRGAQKPAGFTLKKPYSRACTHEDDLFAICFPDPNLQREDQRKHGHDPQDQPRRPAEHPCPNLLTSSHGSEPVRTIG